MKLYANVKSERATKGQGGNNYLEIEIMNIDQIIVSKIKIIPKEKGKILMLVKNNKDLVITEIDEN